MTLGCQPQFHPMIRDGSKPFTIRAYRNGDRQWRAGDTVHLFEKPRQKGMKLIAEFRCTAVQDIMISRLGAVAIADTLLSEDEKDLLAWKDGFRPAGSTETNCAGCFALMLRFWNRHKLRKKEWFYGNIIHWKYDPKGVAPIK